jgi:hypothetical protein
MMILAAGVVWMNNHMRNDMIDGWRRTETRIGTVRVFSDVKITNAN